jgi:hypothetical protein
MRIGLGTDDAAKCQDLGPDKLYSMLRSMTHQSSICAFWLWPGGKLSAHQAVRLRPSHNGSRCYRYNELEQWTPVRIGEIFEPRRKCWPKTWNRQGIPLLGMGSWRHSQLGRRRVSTDWSRNVKYFWRYRVFLWVQRISIGDFCR